jgi:hypothetical protein
MAEVVLRIRLIGGAYVDVTCQQPDAGDPGEVIEHVISTPCEDGGVLRSRHGDGLTVLYGRDVAAVEVSPRGAVL